MEINNNNNNNNRDNLVIKLKNIITDRKGQVKHFDLGVCSDLEDKIVGKNHECNSLLILV